MRLKPDNILCRYIPTVFRPHYKRLTRSSSWNGRNAEQRMMNKLSPAFTEGKVRDYTQWEKGRGANCTHILLCNNKDGEGGGYSIYGRQMFGPVDEQWVRQSRRRLRYFRREGLGVWLWLLTDDDGGWNDQLLRNPEKYAEDLHKSGLLRYASGIVLCLEMTEERWAGKAVWRRFYKAMRKYFKGPIFVHHESDRLDFAAIGNGIMWQTKPGKTPEQIKRAIAPALATGKDVYAFEMSRFPAPELGKAAVEAGAYACDNV